MKRSFLLLVPLFLLLALLLSGCSLTVTDATGDGTTGPATKSSATTSPETEPAVSTATEPTTEPATTAETVIEPADLYEETYEAGKVELGATELVYPSREGVEYPNRLPLSCSPDEAASREDLIEIANYRAFYREDSFTVKLNYAATDAEEELDFLYRNSGFIPSLCALSGTLADGVLSVSLKFYPESFLIPTVQNTYASYIGPESTPPTGADTLPGLDPENGVSVWDSEQAVYAITHGHKIAPIPGSPAETVVNAAASALLTIVDDTMTEWQIAYRIYVYLLDTAVYDYSGEEWAGYSLDPAYEPDMFCSRVVSFRAEGPLLYGMSVCYGYAKSSALMLGLEGINVRRTVSFDEGIVGRTIFHPDPESPSGYDPTLGVHSYNYLKIDGLDYLFDPTYAIAGNVSVLDRTTNENRIVGVYRTFSVGLSYEEHRLVYQDLAPDPIASSPDYAPGNFRYFDAFAYDGAHTLSFADSDEVSLFYDYLLANEFNTAPDQFRTMTLFVPDGQDFYGVYLTQFNSFCEATQIPYRYYYYSTSVGGVTGHIFMVAFGK